MGLNFRKRIKLGKFINLNLGKSGAGLSIGIPGARVSLNSKGESTASLGLPGTGLYYTKKLNSRAKKKAAVSSANSSNDEASIQQALIDYQEAVFALTHIHNQVNDFIDFDAHPIQYQTSEMGPRQIEAINNLENYKPSFFDKLFNKDDDKVKQLQQAVLTAIEQDEANREVKTVPESLTESLKMKQPLAMDQFINDISAFKVLEDDVIGYHYEYVKNVDEVIAIKVNVTVNLQEDVLDSVSTVLKSGKLSHKKLNKADLYQRQLAYISSVTLAFVTEALATTPLDTCLINVYNQSTSIATGSTVETCILAGEFKEASLLPLDYETLDANKVIQNSQVDLNFSDKTGFKEIQPI